MGLLKKAVLFACVAIVALWLKNFVPGLHFGRVTWNQRPGPCRLIDGVEHGSEDIEILADGTALITSGMRFGEHLEKLLSHVKGQVLLFDFNRPQQGVQALALQGFDVATFNPHGITAWTDKKGVTTVFVVNHPIGVSHDRVEKFTYDAKKKALVHVRSIEDERFHYINDLSATSADTFYVTRILSNQIEPWRTLEILSMVPLGGVLYYDGQAASLVVDSLSMPNGVFVSPDQKRVYVAQRQNLLIFDRNSNNSLTLSESVYHGSEADNLVVDADSGDIWLGAHPILWKAAVHLQEPLQTAPSLVLRFKMAGGHVTSIEQVFADDGHVLSASTVAAYRKGGLLIGTIMHKLMYCEVKHLGME